MRTPHIQSRASDVIAEDALRAWRTFVEDLAAIGGHVAYATHDGVYIAAPPERMKEASAMIERRLCDYVGNVMRDSITLDVMPALMPEWVKR